MQTLTPGQWQRDWSVSQEPGENLIGMLGTKISGEEICA